MKLFLVLIITFYVLATIFFVSILITNKLEEYIIRKKLGNKRHQLSFTRSRKWKSYF